MRNPTCFGTSAALLLAIGAWACRQDEPLGPTQPVATSPRMNLTGSTSLRLVGTEVQVTSSPAWETNAVLGDDVASRFVAFASNDNAGGPRQVYYQRLSFQRPPILIGPPVQVSSGGTDDQLEDVSRAGDYIVYTSYVSTKSLLGAVKLYEVSSGVTTTLSELTEIHEARLHGRLVAWVEGHGLPSRLMLADLDALARGERAIQIAGSDPPARDVAISDRLVAWVEQSGAQFDVVAREYRKEASTGLTLGPVLRIASDPTLLEHAPSTSGPWIVWQSSTGDKLAPVRIEAYNVDTDERRTIAENGAQNHTPTIDRDLIAYESNITGNSDVYLYHLSAGQTFQVTAHPVDQFLNDNALYGDFVTYLDQRDGNVDLFVTAFAFEPVEGPNTAPGSNVTVEPVDPTTGTSPVTLTFEEVGSGGETSVTTSGTGPPPPHGFKLGTPPVYYEIETTAGYTSPITVCIDYTGVLVGNENTLKLMHTDGSGWVDVTLPGYPDIENDVICGAVSSLSLFIVVEQDVGCANVTQVARTECDALVALYNSTDGVNWTNNTNWLQTNEPCSWYGVNCVGGALTELLLGRNQLSGTIPAELGNLRSLRFLHLFDNRLGGAIPATLGNLTNLAELIANHNQLTGAIPAELGDLASLRSLFLNSNQISGAIPAALGDLATLEVLALNENQLSGRIPVALGNLGNLQALRLQLNALRGLVPLAVAQLGGRLGPIGCSFRPTNDALYVPDTPDYRAADLDHDGFICGVGFTADVGVVAADITEIVNGLFDAGVINSGQRNGLSRKIDQALTLRTKGKYVEAIDVLRGFIQQVNDLVILDGVLTDAQAQPLVEAAEVMIALLEAEMTA